jgi:hypothetical protein
MRLWAPVSRAGHLGSVGMIMRILTMIVIIFIARCTEKMFESVTSGTYQQLKFWNRRHDTEYIAWGSYCLYLVPVVRGLVAGQLRSQRLPAYPLQNKKIASSHYSTLYSMKYCFIFVNPSWVRPSVQFIFLISNFFQKRITDFNLF